MATIDQMGVQMDRRGAAHCARGVLRVAGPFIGLMGAFMGSTPALAQNALAESPPLQMRDQTVELSMKIKQPFSIVSVGDMVQLTPINNSNDPRVQYLAKIMRGADMTTANNENVIVNPTTFTGVLSHLGARPIIADDWASMGIKMVNKANNHTFEDGEEGEKENLKELQRVGIVSAGVGPNMTEARLARYYTTPKGTVGMVGVYAISPGLMAAPTGRVVRVTPEQLAQIRAIRDSIVARRGEVSNPIMIPPPDPEGMTSVWGIVFKLPTVQADTVPSGDPLLDDLLAKSHSLKRERPQISWKANTLRLKTFTGVTAEQMAQIRAIANDAGSGDVLNAWDLNFKVMSKPGEYRYEMDPQDERDILREVRTGKQFSDMEVVQIHWHQNRYAFQHYSFDHYPPEFEIKFAHDAIDQGADVVVGHGVHTIKGIEIYKGKPIFYGVANFVMQVQRFEYWRDRAIEKPPTPLDGPIVGEGEDNESRLAWIDHPDNFVALLVSSHFENGKLTEVKIYPVDCGGPDRPVSQVGIPRKGTPEFANRILKEVVESSKPFGTKIEIKDGVGIIRL